MRASREKAMRIDERKRGTMGVIQLLIHVLITNEFIFCNVIQTSEREKVEWRSDSNSYCFDELEGLAGMQTGFKERRNQGQGQTDDVEVAAFNAGNPAGRAALDGVGAGLVHGFAGGDIGGDFFV